MRIKESIINLIDTEVTIFRVYYNDETKTENLIEKHIGRISNGKLLKNSKDNIYNKLNDFFKTKSSKTVYGAISEFFMHIVLNERGYEQNSLFFNLEENSIKKGFDGVYKEVTTGNFWLAESKSSSKENQTHIDNLKKALNDLIEKVNKGVPNNPWRNAINHILVSVGFDEDLIVRFTKISEDYERGIYLKPKDINVIPVSTLFFTNEVNNDQIEKIISKMDFQNCIIICIENLLSEWFIHYVGTKS